MNKHCFRLIFSKSLGFLIPVAETTRAQRKPGQTSCNVASSTSPFFSLKRLAASLLLAGLPGWAFAELVVDPARGGETNVISAPNGVPVIEIANPNGKGLSHNRFSEFDVAKPGVIFNNSQVNGVSQLGGALLRNPNLQRQATAILSEVTGNKPSSISGTLEVFGGRADILIANGDESTDDLHELSVRNRYMGNMLNSYDKYNEPGVLAVFGYEHLSRYLNVSGELEPVLQQVTNVAESNVYNLAPVFHDYETGAEYFDWGHLGERGRRLPNMSTYWPYKEITVAGSDAVGYQTRETVNHVLINTAGERASDEVEHFKGKYPDTHVVFDVTDGALTYRGGDGADGGQDLPAKVFFLPDNARENARTEALLEKAARKLGRRIETLTVKPLKLPTLGITRSALSDLPTGADNPQERGTAVDAAN